MIDSCVSIDVRCLCRCSLTHNFDRDRQFGFCAADKAQPEGLLTEFLKQGLIYAFSFGGDAALFSGSILAFKGFI